MAQDLIEALAIKLYDMRVKQKDWGRATDRTRNYYRDTARNILAMVRAYDRKNVADLMEI